MSLSLCSRFPAGKLKIDAQDGGMLKTEGCSRWRDAQDGGMLKMEGCSRFPAGMQLDKLLQNKKRLKPVNNHGVQQNNMLFWLLGCCQEDSLQQCCVSSVSSASKLAPVDLMNEPQRVRLVVLQKIVFLLHTSQHNTCRNACFVEAGPIAQHSMMP